MNADVRDGGSAVLMANAEPRQIVCSGPAVPVTESTSVLVGRETELSVITSALHDARAGHGSGMCFTGPPGIGRTSPREAAKAAEPRR